MKEEIAEVIAGIKVFIENEKIFDKFLNASIDNAYMAYKASSIEKRVVIARAFGVKLATAIWFALTITGRKTYIRIFMGITHELIRKMMQDDLLTIRETLVEEFKFDYVSANKLATIFKNQHFMYLVIGK